MPAVVASVGDGPSVVATRGSPVFTTGTTTASDDREPVQPAKGLTTQPGDRITLALPAGLGVLRWEGDDGPAVGDAGNVWLPVDIDGRPQRIDVPVPNRPGDSIATYVLWLESADSGSLASSPSSFRVTIAGP